MASWPSCDAALAATCVVEGGVRAIDEIYDSKEYLNERADVNSKRYSKQTKIHEGQDPSPHPVQNPGAVTA